MWQLIVEALPGPEPIFISHPKNYGRPEGSLFLCDGFHVALCVIESTWQIYRTGMSGGRDVFPGRHSR
jgi:hypothetical protein